jgi:hypothetical protein
MSTPPLFNVATPGLVLLELGLGLIALCLLNLLISLVEGVTLTLLKWGPFRRSVLVALLMNIISSLAGSFLLILLQSSPLLWLVFSFALSVLIEAGVLLKTQPTTGRRTWLMSLTANLASYIILILPAYLYSLTNR